MNNLTKLVLITVFTLVFLLLIYQQAEIQSLKHPEPQPTTNSTINSNLTPNPTVPPKTTPKLPPGYTEVPSTIVSTDLEVIPQGGFLVLTGNVTNKSPNTLYNVGLYVYSWGYPFIQGGPETLINDIVPIASGTYPDYQELKLSKLAPNESVSIIITIYSNYDERTPTLQGNQVTVIQAKEP